MTYRPLEIIECGAVLVHVDETGYSSRATLAEYLRPGEHYIQATPETMNVSIEAALAAAYQMPAKAFDFIESEYSYHHQYERLFGLAMTVRRGKRFSTREWSRHAFAVHHLTGFNELAKVHEDSLIPEDLLSWKMLKPGKFDLSLWRPEDPEDEAVWRTDLARGEDPTAVYARHWSLARR